MTILMDHISITGNDLDASNIALLTEGSLEGSGVFDTLMQTVKLHLMEEFNADRITGKEYSTVYLGALSSVLQQAVSYILTNKEAEKLDAIIGLTRQQIVTELAKTSDTIPDLLAFNSKPTVDGLMGQESAINAQKILMVEEEIGKAKDERALIGQKIVTEVALTSDSLMAVASAGYGYSGNAAIAGSIALDKLKATKEGTLLDNKATTEIDNALLVREQKTKVGAEINLLNQKTESEKAQTVDDVTAGTVAGVIGKQKELFAAQTAGFSRDAEQKLLKIMVDPLIAQLAGNSATPLPTYLDNANLNAILAKALTSITVTPVTPA